MATAPGRLKTSNIPLGIGGNLLHEWIFATRSGRQMIGADGGTEDIDDAFFAARDSGVGATIMGRNMFGPYVVRGHGRRTNGPAGGGRAALSPFGIVLTHYPQPSIEMREWDDVSFIDAESSGARAALDAAGERECSRRGRIDQRSAIPSERLIDDMRLAMVPVLLGGCERLIEDLDQRCRLRMRRHVCSPSVTHVRIQHPSESPSMPPFQ